MSIEITLHPKSASRDNLRQLLVDLGYVRCGHLWDWPKDSLHFHWFNNADYLSYDGVEATIYRPSSDDQENSSLGACEWALHTRTRSSASPDKDYQDQTIRAARAKFGGSFYNDWHGKNRYTYMETDGRDAVSRGIYLTYEGICRNIKALRFVVPEPLETMQKLVGTKDEILAHADPNRVLYNALVPFALASLEHFFSKSFKVLLRYDTQEEKRLSELNRKVDFEDVIAIKNGTKSLEDVVAGWYSFQNISGIHKAFKDWLDIDFWKIVRRK